MSRRRLATVFGSLYRITGRDLTWLLCAALTAAHGSSGLWADDLPAKVDYTRQIAPILQSHCLDCHGADQREGGLLLTSRVTALLPTDSGKIAISPSQPDQSELISRVVSDDPDVQMPPDDRLADEQIELLKRWIAEGAVWPESPQETHWAYKPPKRWPLPTIQNSSWPSNAIDYFILARMEADGLSPSPEAERAQLMRRVYLDLTGLPPTPDQVDSFLMDSSPDAYEQVVERLLGSPAYGEKWARHWLDLARYSDSNGYQADQLRQTWAYRDWVIQAMNDDLPFDQFTIEQLAGDLLPGAGLPQRIATGFHRATTCNVEAGVDPEANRTDQIIDRVNTTSTVWLGTTMECAQCHNHKYDPFSQQDYYRLFAFFNNTPMEVRQANNPNGVQFDFWGPKMDLPQSEAEVAKRQQAEEELKRAQEELRLAEEGALTRLPQWEAALTESVIAQLNKKLRDIVSKAPKQRSKAELNQLQKYFLSQVDELSELRKGVDQCQAKRDSLIPKTTLVMVEMDETRPTNIFVRGQYLSKGPAVTPGTPLVLHNLQDDAPRNRLSLARWLVSSDNPLVGRVTVNRWWQELFGQGLVSTPEDFGTQGDQPTHPKLLDWLADQFVAQQWSMKQMHRLIVTSATYRQSSRLTSELAQQDLLNRRYSRASRVRLPAEAIRDNALAISGLLSRAGGGPPVYPPQPKGLWRQAGRNEPVFNVDQHERRYRRGVYVVWRRAAPFPSFVNFDAPDRMSCVVARSRTNTPMQALTLLNDEAFVEMAKSLALRAINHRMNPRDRIVYAFRLCVARRPNARELQALIDLYEAELARFAEQPQAADHLAAGFEGFDSLGQEDRQSWAAMFCIANTLLNLDETITKG